MKMRLLRIAKLQELLEQIPDNLEIYRSGEFEYLSIDKEYYFELENEIDESKLLQIDCDDNDNNEISNCKLMFEAMKELSLYLAREERLWAYITHNQLLSYTRKRWPIPSDNEKAIKHIRKHFFALGARGFERDNSASRLWWMAKLCDRVDGLTFEQALNCLLYRSDVRANIIERPTTSQNIKIFSALLKKLNMSLEGDKEVFNRKTLRKAMKNINLIGGIKLLEALNENEVVRIIDDSFTL